MSDQEVIDRKRELAIALKRDHARKLRLCFNPFDPDSRPTEPQLEILKDIATVLFQFVQGGNQSGKSQCGARVAAWFFQRNHPYLDIDKMWPGLPMVILVMGRLNNQVEELWEKKIKPFLSRTEWRENRQGGTLQYVENPVNKSKIIFATHNNPAEAREKVQSYSAHFVWLDELTDHLGVIEELQRRTNFFRGRMMITYTPKIQAKAVRKFIETPTSLKKVYRISMLDNPAYKGREQELLDQINALPEEHRQTILEGDWFVGEASVFSFDGDMHMEDPPRYSELWPHVISVDPAASGLMGFSLWAAPYKESQRWWCVRSEYIKGAAPSDLIAKVEEMTKGLQILYRICDTHETWFLKEATKMKISYRVVPNKKGRKLELIANLNQALANGRIRIAHTATDLIAELTNAQWSEKVEDKIVNASDYHLADTAQYFVDQIPLFKDSKTVPLTFDQELHQANQKRKIMEAMRADPRKKKPGVRILARRGRVWKR